MDLQVIGKDGIADEIGDECKASRSDHRRNDSKTVEPVSQVDRVRRANDHQNSERHKKPAKLEQHILEKWHRKRISETCGRHKGNRDAGNGAEQNFQAELDPAGKPVMGIPTKLAVVVE